MSLDSLVNNCSGQITAWAGTPEEIRILPTTLQLQQIYKGWESNSPESFLNFSS